MAIKSDWWKKTLIGIGFTICAAVISVLWTDRMLMESRIRTIEVKVGRTESFQSEVLRRLDRIERKIDHSNGSNE